MASCRWLMVFLYCWIWLAHPTEDIFSRKVEWHHYRCCPNVVQVIKNKPLSFSWDYVALLRFPFLRGPSSTDEAQRAERAFVVVPYRVCARASSACRVQNNNAWLSSGALSVVIRLGFGRITGFPAKSCSLLVVYIAYKVLKYNDFPQNLLNIC